MQQSLIVNCGVQLSMNYYMNFAKTLKIIQRNLPIFRTHSLFTTKKYGSTIYALSSGVKTAISIVRISGPQAYQVLSLLHPQAKDSKQSRQQLLSKYKVKARQMKLANIYGPEKGLIDKCLLVFFQAAHSYTGQDIFELHTHGSIAVVQAVFGELSKFNFKMARRGQFTRRALTNNRIDLHQAEAINDIIQSQSEFQRQIAMGNLLGRNKQFLEGIRKDIIKAMTLTQAFIQFQEEEVGKGLLNQAKMEIQKINQKCIKVLESSERLQTLKQGVKVSIVGRPNVGKSTLINAMVKKDVAIVSNIPGTTRDLIESGLQIQGIKVLLVDTAGIRSSNCQIEIQGIKRSKISMAQSHFSIVLFDLNTSQYTETEDSIVIQVHPDEQEFLQYQNSMLILNKADLCPHHIRKKGCFLKKKNDSKVVIFDSIISLKQSSGIEVIMQKFGLKLKQRYDLFSMQSSEVFFTRQRYIQGLKHCCLILEDSKTQAYADLVSCQLRNALIEIDELVGKVDSEQILDHIFANFCIGK